MKAGSRQLVSFPIKRRLTITYVLSLLVAILSAVASIAGIIFRSTVYTTDELINAFVSNDVVNLLVGLPLLLGSMLLASRGRLAGLLCWPGALLFVLYNYIAYLFALSLSAAYLVYVALVIVSACAFVDLIMGIDMKAVGESLTGAVPEKAAGGVLAVLGLLFFLRAIWVLANVLSGEAVVEKADLAVNVSDILISPLWVIGGMLLWRRREFGYAVGLGLLLAISMLFVALITFLLLQPLLTTVPFAPVDVAVISVMSLICFIPLVLFMRSVLAVEKI